jgi:hypothetical protein
VFVVVQRAARDITVPLPLEPGKVFAVQVQLIDFVTRLAVGIEGGAG